MAGLNNINTTMSRHRSPADEILLEETTSEETSPSSPQNSTTNDRVESHLTLISLVLNLSGSLLFGYAIYFHNYHPQGSLFNKVLHPSLQPFGLWKFLTYDCLVVQLISCLLHLAAQAAPKYSVVRDLVFTTLAYPIGSFVVYSFWVVWWTQGREVIFPKSMEIYYPVWLNHTTHTLVAPLNIAQAYLTFHKFIRNGTYVPVTFMFGYCSLLLFIRWKAGMFVYPFLNQMDSLSIAIYFGSILFCTFALYESCFFITGIFHMRKLKRSRVE